MAMLRVCPFCGSSTDYRMKDNGYEIYCPQCENEGYKLSMFFTNFSELKERWNTREFDKKLLKEKSEIINWINQYYDVIEDKKNTSQTLSEYIPYDDLNKEYGCLITDDGTLYRCDYFSHINMLLKIIKVKSFTGDFNKIDDEKLCIKHNIIKVTIWNNVMSILIIDKTNRKQYNTLYDYILNYENIKDIHLFEICNSYDVEKEFNNLEDTLDYFAKRI